MGLELATDEPTRQELLIRTVTEVAALPRDAHRSFLSERCTPPFATAAEWGAASGLVLAPILFHGALIHDGVPADTARRYARALSGIGDRPEDNPIRTFTPLVP